MADRLRIGRGILNADQVAEQTEQAQSQPTSEVMYIYGHENFGLDSWKRATTKQDDHLAKRAPDQCRWTSPANEQPAKTRNPATPRAPSSAASLSSARSSQLATPPSMRRERPGGTGRVVSERGSPMPRGPGNGEQERKGADRRGSRDTVGERILSQLEQMGKLLDRGRLFFISLVLFVCSVGEHILGEGRDVMEWL